MRGVIKQNITLSGSTKESASLSGSLEGFVPAIVPEPVPENLPLFLLSWWDLEEEAGSIRVDSHGDNDASEVLAQVGQAEGVQGSAALFDETSILRVPTNPTLQNWSSVTVSWSGSAWFWPVDADFNGIMSLYSSGNAGGDRSWGTWMYNDRRINFVFYYGTSANYSLFSTGLVTIGEWNFVVWSYDHTSRTMRISLNGSEFSELVIGANNLRLGTYPLIIGSFNNAGSFARLRGRIDSAALWMNYVLTNEDVAWLYNAGAGRRYSDLGI